MTRETHGWRVKVELDSKQVDLLTPALFEMQDIRETHSSMVIYFSMTNFAMFMVACTKLDKSFDITKLNAQVVDIKKEPEVIHSRHMQPRPIKSLMIKRPKEFES